MEKEFPTVRVSRKIVKKLLEEEGALIEINPFVSTALKTLKWDLDYTGDFALHVLKNVVAELYLLDYETHYKGVGKGKLLVKAMRKA
jgi:hypothetical protein